MSERVFLGLGANLGDRRENLRGALRLLARECEIVAVSSLYESVAVVPEGRPPGPRYYNAACEISTELEPQDLLRFVKEIEREIGRRPAERWAPRPIDIDILLYGSRIIDEPGLVVPHPLLAERAFVLAPLGDIAADVPHPTLGRTIGELAQGIEIAGQRYVEDYEWVD